MALEKMRSTIDRIDAEVMQLLIRRFESAVRAGRFKVEVDDPSREAHVIDRAKKRSRGICREEFSEALYRLIIDESKHLQHQSLPLCAFHGGHGAFSEVALQAYNPSWIGIPTGELGEVFEAVASRAVDCGIIPLENSSEGSVSEAHELLIESELFITGEIHSKIEHSLLALPEADHREIREVYGTERALAACRGFIHRHRLTARPFYDNAGAALHLLKERLPATAVIAHANCAELYELEILKENIQDQESTTRYVVIGPAAQSGPSEKCTIFFTTAHRAGALLSALQLFSAAGVNLLRLESKQRITTDQNQVGFLLDFEGDAENQEIKVLLGELKDHVSDFRFLGGYSKK